MVEKSDLCMSAGDCTCGMVRSQLTCQKKGRFFILIMASSTASVFHETTGDMDDSKSRTLSRTGSERLVMISLCQGVH